MVKIRSLIVMALLVGLFIFAMANFGIRLAEEYNTNTTLMHSQAYNQSFGELQSELVGSQALGENQSRVQEQTTPTTSAGDLILESTPRSAFSYAGVIRNIYTSTFGLLAKTLGIPPVVMFVLTAILLITITLLIWALVKTGR